jgi:hypothetical protein
MHKAHGPAHWPPSHADLRASQGEPRLVASIEEIERGRDSLAAALSFFFFVSFSFSLFISFIYFF